MTYRCDLGIAAGLVAPVSGEEIKSALHALPNDKVSGPDGFTKEFFVAAWPIVGKEFIISVQSFFLFGFCVVVMFQKRFHVPLYFNFLFF